MIKGSEVFCCRTPEIAVDRLMEQQRRSLGRLERLSDELARELLPTWDSGRTHTDPLDYVEVLRDAADISERFARIQSEAERELLSFSRPPWVTPSENTAGLEATARMHAAGRTNRALYSRDVLDDPAMLEVIRRFAEVGEEIRIADSLPLKLIVTDGSTVLCDMPDPVARTGATTALVIRHPSLAETLRLAFHSIWEQSPTLEEALKLRDAASRAEAASAESATEDGAATEDPS